MQQVYPIRPSIYVYKREKRKVKTFHISIFDILPFDIYSLRDRRTPLLISQIDDNTHTLGEFCEISAADEIICFQKDGSQPGFSDRIVFQVEFVESMEGIVMSMHIQRIDRQIVGGQMQRFKYLTKGQMFSISKNNDFLNLAIVLKGQTSGDFLSFDLMKRSRCFWFMQEE
jgi:hypothetical protein